MPAPSAEHAVVLQPFLVDTKVSLPPTQHFYLRYLCSVFPLPLFFVSNSRFRLYFYSVSVGKSLHLKHFFGDILPLRLRVIVSFGLVLDIGFFLG